MEPHDHKLNGSTPTGRSRSYTYYTTIRPVKGKHYYVSAPTVEAQIPELLRDICVHPDMVPQIRELYREQVTVLEGPSVDERLVDLQERLERLHDEEAAMARLYAQARLTDRNYDGLYKEWQAKVFEIEQELNWLEDGTKRIVGDLDQALALLACASRLFERLDLKQKWRLLQILFRHIIIDTQGQVIDLELNAPFVYLISLHQAAHPQTPSKGETMHGSGKQDLSSSSKSHPESP